MAEPNAAQDSMLDVDLSNAGDLKTFADNHETKLKIARADIQDSRSHNDRVNLRVILEDPSDPDYDDIYAYLPVPNSEWQANDPKSHKKGTNRFKDFIDTFGVEMPLDVAWLIGLEGWALLSAEPDNEGRMRNGVRRFIPNRASR